MLVAMKVNTGVTLDRDVFDALKAAALRERLSSSDIINRTLAATLGLTRAPRARDKPSEA
mgnify:CR=1 FL=1